jgi:D-3-phosphoglycerate dehydrogenase / 2-oxoglutarate reductase
MATKKILVSDPISDIGVKVLKENSAIIVDVKTGLTEAQLCEIIHEYDGLIVRSQTKVTARLLEFANKLKVVGRAGVGVDNIDRDAATNHGVIVMNTPSGNTISTAELAFTLMLSAARNLALAHQSVISGQFVAARKAYSGIEINGKRLAVIGMGRIGVEFTKRAQAFGMQVAAYDPFLTQARADALRVDLCQTPEVALSGADFVTLHVPLTDSTQHIINAKRLALMNKGAIVVNCARGGLVDEVALKEAIDSGHIAGCGLDVFEEEPPTADHPLFTLKKNIAFTAHLGASTMEAQENVGIQVAEQIRDFFATGEIRNAINMPSLDAGALEGIGAYLPLARSLGKFLAKLGDSNPDSLRVSYHGDIGSKDTSLVSRTVLNAYLESSSNAGGVNIVNAPAVAKEKGLNLVESVINAKTEYAELIVAELTKKGEKFRVAGTIIGQSPRIVEINKLFVDINISGNFIIVRNDDRPGIVGLVGSALGNRHINIANLSLARKKQEGNALSVIEIDSPAPSDLIDELAAANGVLLASAISI